MQTHTHEHACRRPIRQCLAHSAFFLPADWRTEAAKGGLRQRRVARQNGWSHEQRSVYKPKAEQRAGARGGREERIVGSLSLSTIKD